MQTELKRLAKVLGRSRGEHEVTHKKVRWQRVTSDHLGKDSAWYGTVGQIHSTSGREYWLSDSWSAALPDALCLEGGKIIGEYLSLGIGTRPNPTLTLPGLIKGAKCQQRLHVWRARVFLPTDLQDQQVLHKHRIDDLDPKRHDVSNLKWGTAKQNAADRSRDGSQKGDSGPGSKITHDTLSFVLLAQAMGVPARAISSVVGVSRAHVYQLTSGKKRPDEVQKLRAEVEIFAQLLHQHAPTPTCPRCEEMERQLKLLRNQNGQVYPTPRNVKLAISRNRGQSTFSAI